MYYAERELDLAEKRLLEARSNLKLFRKDTNSVDLSASAMAQIELLANLEKELIEINARIEVLKESLDSDAPSIKALERKSEALELQILEKSGGLKITGQMMNYLLFSSLIKSNWRQKKHLPRPLTLRPWHQLNLQEWKLLETSVI